jgi:hypothetical protein
MFKLAIGIGISLLLFCGTAMAACSVPNTLTNGTTADATAVMGNFTSLAGCAAPLASPSFTGSVGIGTGSPISVLDIVQSGSANVRFKSTSTGQASLELDGATGTAAQVYHYMNGTAYWAAGITGNGAANSYDWYSYASSQSVFYLQSNGNATLTGCLVYNGGTLGTCLSDARTKKNIVPFRTGLQQIAALTPVTYEYNGLGESQADGKVRTGLLAQEVQLVAPELVQTSSIKASSTSKDDKPLLAVKYGDLTFALINAVKELKAANDNQVAEIGRLEGQVAVLQRKVDKQTAQR